MNKFENIRKFFHLRDMEIEECSPHNNWFSTLASSIFSNSGILSTNLAAATIGSRQLTALWVNMTHKQPVCPVMDDSVIEAARLDVFRMVEKA